MKATLVFSIASLIFHVVNSITFADLRDRFKRDLTDCQVRNYNLDLLEIDSLMAGQVPYGAHINCLIACALTKSGMIDDKGMFNVERANDIVELVNHDQNRECSGSADIVRQCSKVNNVKLQDQDPECKRAFLLYQCVVLVGSQCIKMGDLYKTRGSKPGILRFDGRGNMEHYNHYIGKEIKPIQVNLGRIIKN